MEIMFPLVLVLLIGAVDSMPRSEPACSRFDYEEKLLAKTVRLEASVDGLKETVSKVEERLDDIVIRVDRIEATLGNVETKKQEMAEESGLLKMKCPSTYKYRQDLNLCWKLEKGVKLNAFEAEERCAETHERAHLMILNSTQIVKFMQEWLKTAGVGDTFVGADDIEDEGSFKWSNGEPVQQIPWASGEPNGGTGSNCLVMDVDLSFKFCDRHCSEKDEFLCQIIL